MNEIRSTYIPKWQRGVEQAMTDRQPTPEALEAVDEVINPFRKREWGEPTDSYEIAQKRWEYRRINRALAFDDFARQARDQALEEAAQHLDDINKRWGEDPNSGHDCSLTVQNQLGSSAATIRALKSKEPT